jgi:hypothetical protein
MHVVVVAVAAAGLLAAGLLPALLTAALLTSVLTAGLLTAAAFARPRTLLAGLIPLALGLLSGLLCSLRLLGAVRHVDSPRMLKPLLR